MSVGRGRAVIGLNTLQLWTQPRVVTINLTFVARWDMGRRDRHNCHHRMKSPSFLLLRLRKIASQVASDEALKQGRRNRSFERQKLLVWSLSVHRFAFDHEHYEDCTGQKQTKSNQRWKPGQVEPDPNTRAQSHFERAYKLPCNCPLESEDDTIKPNGLIVLCWISCCKNQRARINGKNLRQTYFVLWYGDNH